MDLVQHQFCANRADPVSERLGPLKELVSRQPVTLHVHFLDQVAQSESHMVFTGMRMQGSTPRLPLDPPKTPHQYCLPTNTFPALFVLDGCEQGHEAQEVLLSGTSDWLYTTHC